MASDIAHYEDLDERFDCDRKHVGWQELKTLVLDSVSSPITRRVYNMALHEFIGWYRQADRSKHLKRLSIAGLQH